MTAGGLLILFVGKRRTSAELLGTVSHGIVPLIAACAYFAMATGQGAIAIGSIDPAGLAGPARTFYYARYIDWLFTTPILLFTLSFMAMRHGPKLGGAIFGVILADIMMIVTSFAFGASEVPAVKWTWFLVSCIAFLGVFYVIWVVNREANRTEERDVQTAYVRNASLLSVLWLAYPFVLAVAPDGLHVIGDAASVLLIAILDVVSKVVYGLMATAADDKITARELTDGTVGVGKPTTIRAVA